ncbi:hypothetical protein LAWASA_4542 [Lawsonibacter asaccharolyticus]|nr:hypothetical protein LAWASA_4542 [Lawsonibacter asaccharolyticus]
MIGARQYFEYGVFCTELWIDTSRLPDLDTNMPNDFCNSFCQSVRRNMLGLDQTVEMKFFAMGTEMSIDFSEQLEECINEKPWCHVLLERENRQPLKAEKSWLRAMKHRL